MPVPPAFEAHNTVSGDSVTVVVEVDVVDVVVVDVVVVDVVVFDVVVFDVVLDTRASEVQNTARP